MNNNDKKYVIKNNDVYVLEPNKFLLYTGISILIIAIIIAIYDTAKDTIRFLSGVKDVFSDKKDEGVVKILGITKGNIMRYVIMISLFVLSFLLMYLSLVFQQEHIVTDKKEKEAVLKSSKTN